MANKKWSQFDQATSLSDTDEGVGLVSSLNKRFTFSALRTLINTGLQTIIGNITHTGNQTTSGKITASQFEGNGALITGVTAAGSGGSSSTGSLTVQCNSDNSTPAAKIVFSKYATDLADLDENSFSPKTGIPYSHADDTIPFNKSINLSGNEIIQCKTIQDLQPFPYYWLNGTSDYLSAADDVEFNFGTDDFSILFPPFKTTSATAAIRYMYRKKAAGAGAGIATYLNSSHKFVCLLHTDADYTLTSDNALNDGKKHTPLIRVDRDGTAYLLIDGVIQTNTATPGAISISNSEIIYIGQYGSASYFPGELYGPIIFWNRLISAENGVSYSSSPLKALEYADIGASNTDLTSGTLTVGKRYRINTYIVSDDFTNVGAASNATGIEFIATGTTPTTWTASSILRQIGATAVYLPQDFTEGYAKDSSGNGNHLTNNGAELANVSEQLTEIRGSFTSALTCGTSGTITLNTSLDTLSYTKHGSKASFGGEITVSSVSSPVGDLILTGIPNDLASLSESSEHWMISVSSVGTLASAQTGALTGYIDSSGIHIRDGAGTTTGTTSDFAAHIQAGSKLSIHGEYITND